MNILCAIFGHRYNKYDYGKVITRGVDNIGREHARVQMQCCRCEETIDAVCSIHLPERYAEQLVRRRLADAERLLQCSSGDGI